MSKSNIKMLLFSNASSMLRTLGTTTLHFYNNNFIYFYNRSYAAVILYMDIISETISNVTFMFHQIPVRGDLHILHHHYSEDVSLCTYMSSHLKFCHP